MFAIIFRPYRAWNLFDPITQACVLGYAHDFAWALIFTARWASFAVNQEIFRKRKEEASH